MRPFFILLLLLAAVNISAQSTMSIEGKWKMVGMFSDEMYYNTKTDSTSFSPMMLENIEFANARDSLNKMEAARSIMKEMLQYMKNEPIFNGALFFGKNGVYQEIHNDTVTTQGKYSIDTQNNIIYLTVKRNDVVSKEESKFKFKGQALHILLSQNDEEPLYVIYEKIE